MTTRFRAIHIAGTLAVFFASIQFSSAAIRYVAKHGSNANPGTLASPWLTIDHAVDNSTSSDEIRVGEGLYTEAVTFNSGGPNTLTVRGGYETNTWTWSPSNRVTAVDSGSSSTDVFTLQTHANTLVAMTIRGGRYGVWLGYGANVRHTVTHCTITNNANHGINLTQTGGKGGVIVKNCLVANNGGNGVLMVVDNGPTSSIYNSTFADNSGSGVASGHFWQSITDIKNCLAANNGAYGFYWFSSGQARGTLDNCCSYGNAGGNFSSGAMAGNSKGTMLVLNDANIAGYPAFVGSGNYDLTSASVCIDAGTDLSGSGVTDDIEGKTRSAPYDIGCFETAFSAPAKSATTYADAARPDDAGAGTSPATAKKTINAAMAITSDGGTVDVAAGTYAEDVLVNVHNVTLDGAGASSTIVTTPVSFGVWIISTNSTVRQLTATGAVNGFGLAGPNNSTDVIDNRMEQCNARGNGVGVLVPQAWSGTFDRRPTIDRCVVTNNTSYGVYSPHRTAVVMKNALIADNGNMGVRMTADNCPYASYIYNCTIVDNAGNGYQDENNSHKDTTIVNSIISDNSGIGVSRKGSAGGFRDRISYSCVYNHADNNFRGPINNATDTLLILPGTISGRPDYVGGGDYQLQNTSPCIDSGTTLTGGTITVTVDLNGTARTPGSYDMGCFESAFSAPAKLATIYVDAARPDDTGDGSSPATAKKTIGAGAAITAGGGTCNVAAGTYFDTVLAPANVTISGAGAGLTIVTSGWFHAAYFADTGATIKGMTLRGSKYGVNFQGTGNTLSECTVGSNIYYGVDCVAHNNTIDQSKVQNSPTYGIYMHANARITLNRTEVSDNGDHGVYCANKGAVNARNCLVADNAGNGIYIVSDNSAYVSYLDYSTFAGNTGDGYEDNHHWHKGTYMTNCVSAGNGGYGYQRRTASNARNNYIDHSLINSNTLGDVIGIMVVLQSGNITNQAPSFQAGGYRLESTSPGVEGGVDIGVAVDIVGAARPGFDFVDMGAYEFRPPPGTVMYLR